MDVRNWAESIGYYDELKENRRVLSYGEAGSGKTLFGSTFPSPFVVDTDRGGLTLQGLRIPHIALERGTKVFDIVLDVMRRIKAKTTPFDTLTVETLVFDSLTTLTDDLMVEAMLFPANSNLSKKDPANYKPEWDHYAMVENRTKTIVKMSQDLGVHVLYIALPKLEKDDVTGSFVCNPNLVGGYREKIEADVDYVFYHHTDGQKDKKKFLVNTSKYSYYRAKTRTPLAFQYENPTFGSIFGTKE